MSLVCNECGDLISPSLNLPGREGVYFHPVLLSYVWVFENLERGQEPWTLSHVAASWEVSICFACIAKNISQKRQGTLRAIYRAYEAETELERIRLNQEGRWCGRDEISKSVDAFDNFEKQSKKVPKTCLYCATLPESTKKPYFVARVINRPYSEKHLTPISGAYSWSNIKKGLLGFSVCFDCFRVHLPQLFEQYSYALRGLRRTSPPTKSQFSIDIDFLAKLKEELGEEKFREQIRSLREIADIKIITDEN